MKTAFCFLFLFGVLALAGISANAQCKVTDPTGTPLNIRTLPNGKVIGTVANGTTVHIEDKSTDDNGKLWVSISVYRRTKYVVLGWVYREFISCY